MDVACYNHANTRSVVGSKRLEVYLTFTETKILIYNIEPALNDVTDLMNQHSTICRLSCTYSDEITDVRIARCNLL